MRKPPPPGRLSPQRQKICLAQLSILEHIAGTTPATAKYTLLPDSSLNCLVLRSLCISEVLVRYLLHFGACPHGRTSWSKDEPGPTQQYEGSIQQESCRWPSSAKTDKEDGVLTLPAPHELQQSSRLGMGTVVSYRNLQAPVTCRVSRLRP